VTVYGKERLCIFDGYYYCYECHENSEHYIPAYIVFNWDFRPYQGFNNFQMLTTDLTVVFDCYIVKMIHN